MSASYHIEYVVRKEIDTEKWDACMESASNSLIYGRSWFLDHMAEGQWDGLIIGDYDAVMPLPWRKKWGIRYLYQPPFTQQLGIFSANPSLPALITACLTAIRRHFRFAEIFLNYDNAHPAFNPYTNIILDLNTPYEKIAANYKTDLQNNLKKAVNASFQYTDQIDLLPTLTLFQQQYGPRMPHVNAAAYASFQALCHTLQQKGQLELRGVKDAAGMAMATAVLPKDNKRLYLLQNTVLSAGRQRGANHFLLDRLIHEFAVQPLLFDFEGSGEPGIAHFYRNFGGKDQPYYFHRHNDLSWPLRLFK
jgi:hypothetical protein